MKEIIIKVRDDLDGSDADETIEFTVRGISYEIDLSAANVELFEKSMQQFIDVARRQQQVKAASSSLTKFPRDKRALMAQRREIRVWASQNGWPALDESTKGRLPYDAVEAFQATHPEVKLAPEIIPNRAPGSSLTQRKSRAAAKDDGLDSITAQDMLALGDGDGVPVSELMGGAKAAATTQENRRKKFGKKLDKLTQTQRTEIREWANANGIHVAPTGFIKNEALEAYFDAHPEEIK
jgi:hypothetical protein